jgi:hypothetical protein
MPFPCDQHHIAFVRTLNCPANGCCPIFLDMVIGTRACRDLADNDMRVLPPGIVAGDDDLVSQPCRYGAKQRPFTMVALAPYLYRKMPRVKICL